MPSFFVWGPGLEMSPQAAWAPFLPPSFIHFSQLQRFNHYQFSCVVSSTSLLSALDNSSTFCLSSNDPPQASRCAPLFHCTGVWETLFYYSSPAFTALFLVIPPPYLGVSRSRFLNLSNYSYLGPDEACVGADLCTAGCLSASLASTP